MAIKDIEEENYLVSVYFSAAPVVPSHKSRLEALANKLLYKGYLAHNGYEYLITDKGITYVKTLLEEER